MIDNFTIIIANLIREKQSEKHNLINQLVIINAIVADYSHQYCCVIISQSARSVASYQLS